MESDKVLVKLFILNDENSWEDKCTGFLHFYELEGQDQQPNSYRLVISDDLEAENVLFHFDLNPDVQYGRQQDTLITWEEDQCELALSFQSSLNCQLTYDTILKSIRIMKNEGDEMNDNALQNSDASVSRAEESIEFPEFKYENLSEIATLFSEAQNSAIRREQLCRVIEKPEHIRAVIDMFHDCESLDDTQGLTSLYIIVKSIFSFPKYSVLEVILHDDYLLDIIGILEYNPGLSTPVKHREILESSQMLEIIPFSNKTLRDLIVRTHRLQYLQDIVLPCPVIFEERAAFLSSYVFFHKNEIMDYIFDDKLFLSTLFSVQTVQTDDATFNTNLLKLISEIFSFSRILQGEQKEKYILRLLAYDVLPCLQKFMDLPGTDKKPYIVEIFYRIADANADSVRQLFVASQENGSNLLIYIMDCLSHDVTSNASQTAVQLLKVTFEITNANRESSSERMDKDPNTAFLDTLYGDPFNHLMSPFFAYTSDLSTTETSFTKALTIEHILELVQICISCHSYYIKNYLFRNDGLKNVASLINSRHLFLCHCAVKTIRRAIGNSDDFYVRYLIREKILDILFKSLLTRHTKYNIVNSAILELFEFLRISNNRPISVDFVTRNRHLFDKIAYATTFKKLSALVDHFGKDKEFRTNLTLSLPQSQHNSRYSPPSTEIDGISECPWFDEDNADEENGAEDRNSIEHIEENGDLEFSLPPIKPKFLTDEDDSIALRPIITRPSINIRLKRSSVSSRDDLSEKLPPPHEGPLVDYSDDELEENLPPCDDYTIDNTEENDAPCHKKSNVVDVT